MHLNMIFSSQLDLPLSEAFYKWILGQEQSFTAQDLQHVDPVLSRSFAQLADVAVRKHHLESDPLLVSTCTFNVHAMNMYNYYTLHVYEIEPNKFLYNYTLLYTIV